MCIIHIASSIRGRVFNRIHARREDRAGSKSAGTRHHNARTIVRSRRDRVRYHCIAFIHIRTYRDIGWAGDHRISIVYDRYRHVAGRRVAACIRGRYRDRRLTVEGHACNRILRHRTGTPQLSASSVIPVRTSGTTSLQLASVMFAGQVKVGGVFPATVTVATQVLLLPAASVTVSVTLLSPVSAQSNALVLIE